MSFISMAEYQDIDDQMDIDNEENEAFVFEEGVEWSRIGMNSV